MYHDARSSECQMCVVRVSAGRWKPHIILWLFTS